MSSEKSLSEVNASIQVPQSGKRWRRALAFLGPAYLISVGYMDPGNWATDLAGGSKFGYSLLWVLLMSNVMALLLQSLSARLGIVRGLDLAQANRHTYPKFINFILYLFAEIAIAATDLAEVLGMAIGIQLLTGIPLIWGVAITVLDTFLLLFLQQLGMRKMEAFILTLVAIVAFCFFAQIWMAAPDFREVSTGLFPSLPNHEALYIAIGIIGATVMPHNLYLHSSLVQTRNIEKSETGIKQALKWNFLDSSIALNIAFMVNASILILAATLFYKSGRTDIADIKDAHQLLAPLLGNELAPTLFAIALIAAGQSSTVTGTLAGQIVMEGYLQLRINPWLRRLITRLIAILPAIVLILIYGEQAAGELLVFSQVVLSLQLGFAIIPLIHFVSEKKSMKSFTIDTKTKLAAWTMATILVYLNLSLVFDWLQTAWQASNQIWQYTAIILGALSFLSLLFFVVFTPILSQRSTETKTAPHLLALDQLPVLQPYQKIAIALDFSKDDYTLIAHALQYAQSQTAIVLIHIVESAGAQWLGQQSNDREAIEDQERLNHYVQFIQEKDINAVGRLGFNQRIKGITAIVKEEKAELLIMGAHGHSGWQDWLYGETVNKVRHKLKIPVLVVRLPHQ